MSTRFRSRIPPGPCPTVSSACPSGAANTERALDPRSQERLLRLVGDLSQDESAVAAGMSRGFASLIEKGSHGVDVVRLIRLAKRWMCRCWSWWTSVLHWLIVWRLPSSVPVLSVTGSGPGWPEASPQ